MQRHAPVERLRIDDEHENQTDRKDERAAHRDAERSRSDCQDSRVGQAESGGVGGAVEVGLDLADRFACPDGIWAVSRVKRNSGLMDGG